MKLMTSLNEKVYRELQAEALSRGVTIQELLRVAIIPEWFRNFRKTGPEKERDVPIYPAWQRRPIHH